MEKLHITYPDLQDGKEIASSTYLRLAQLQGNAVFFPSLQILYLNTPASRNDPMSLFQLPLFLSPTLTSITISHLGEDAAGSLANFLLNNSAGPLAILILHSVELSPLLATSISECQLLESLDLTLRGPLEYSLLQVILSCPLLSYAKLNTENSQYTQTTNAITARDHIGEIGQIHLEGQIAMVEDVVTVTSDRNMLGLAITLHGLHDEQTIQNLLRRIAVQQASIVNLTINLENRLVTDASFFASLVSPNNFHGLQRLEFRELAFRKLDQHLPQILSHWQNIQHLSFGCTIGSISLATLKLVTQSCPSLSSFAASFDSPGTTFDAPGGISDCLLSHKLLRLSLIPSDPEPNPNLFYYDYRSPEPISEIVAQQVARYIYALFPDLEDIEYQWKGRDYWRPVAESYKLIQSFCRREVRELNDMRQRQRDGAGD